LIELRFETTLPAPVDAVWDRVASMEGINDELGPWMRMTAPRGTELTPEAVPLGERWFRSWILAFGVIPIDYDDLCLVSVDPPHGFHERSSMLSARVWVHKRTLTAEGDGTRLVDELGFEPRLPLFGPVLRALIPRVFRHRHKRLRRYFS
jgi:ligand-binding SRPBCC domain-containing protein